MSNIISSHLPCPMCLSSDAFSIYDDGHGYCFSCHKTKKGDQEISDDVFTYEYISRRGITAATHKFYEAKAKINSEGKPVSLGYVYPNKSVKVRHFNYSDKKYKFRWSEKPKATPSLYGSDRFAAGSHKFLIITEGEDDALSMYQVTHVPSVSVQSSSSAHADIVSAREYVGSFERVYLAFDSDEPGQRALRRVSTIFEPGKVWAVKFSNRKDATEHVENGEGDQLLNIWLNSRQYLPDNVVSSLEDFEKILNEPPKPGVPYPFKKLTEMTYGIRRGEIVLITAQEGVGKTELMHAIEHKLLTETKDNVGAIFLEEQPKRHLQALAGIELRRPVHLPDSGCRPGETVAALRKVLEKDGRLFLYSHFGSTDTELLRDTIRYLVSGLGCVYVLLDHVTMAVSGIEGDDERRKLDKFSTDLTSLSRELDCALIIVSHVNDMGQTRGSRYVGKVADIRIDCHRDLLNPDPVEANTTHLTVSKNRYCGRTGIAGSLYFDQATNTYTEIGGESVGHLNTQELPYVDSPSTVPEGTGMVSEEPSARERAF